MPAKFEPLAVYNAECARGIVHTDEYRERMAKLKDDFRQWSRSRMVADGYEEIEPDLWRKKTYGFRPTTRLTRTAPPKSHANP